MIISSLCEGKGTCRDFWCKVAVKLTLDFKFSVYSHFASSAILELAFSLLLTIECYITLYERDMIEHLPFLLHHTSAALQVQSPQLIEASLRTYYRREIKINWVALSRWWYNFDKTTSTSNTHISLFQTSFLAFE